MELSAGYLLGLTRPSSDRTNEAQGSPLPRTAHRRLHRHHYCCCCILGVEGCKELQGVAKNIERS